MSDEIQAAMISGAKIERERIKAITSLDEAKGREAAALHLAVTSSISADSAKAVLAGLPKTSPYPAGGRSGDNPIGLALYEEGAPNASGAMSPEEVAASVNKNPIRGND